MTHAAAPARKLPALLATAALVATSTFVLVPAAAYAEEPGYTDDSGIEYQLADEGAVVTGYSGGESTMTVPSHVEVEGQVRQVVGVAERAFAQAFSPKFFTSVTFQGPIEYIGEDAFVRNTINELAFEDSVGRLERNAFSGNGLTEVDFGGTVDYVGLWAFRGNELTELVFPAAVSEISASAFSAAFSDTNPGQVRFEGPVGNIGDSAFQRVGLTSVTFGDEVEEIGRSAFSGNSINELAFEASVGILGQSAFSSNGLTEVEFGGPVDHVGVWAFLRNELTELVFPEVVNIIDANAFQAAFSDTNPGQVRFEGPVGDIRGIAFIDNNLRSVSFESSVGDISHSVFDSVGLEDVTFGGSVGEIDGSAFARNSLTSVTFGGAVGEIGTRAFVDNSLSSVTFEHRVGEIRSNAFAGNPLTSVTFGDEVNEIQGNAFSGTELSGPGLSAVNFHAEVGIIGSEAFVDNNLQTVTFDGQVGNLAEFAFGQNPLTAVHFAGSPPESIVGADDENFRPSLGDDEGLVVTYTCDYREGLYPDGFTSPTWHGYNSQGELRTVTFEDGEGNEFTDQAVECGATIEAPANTPERQGYDFTGWYTDEDTTESFDFDTVIDSNLTLYAGWQHSPVAELQLHANVLEVDEGDLVTFTATGTTADGYDLGDVTDDTTLTSSVNTDVINGNQVTFPTASEHVITATHVDGATAQVTITVVPAAQEPGDDEAGEEPVEEETEAGQDDEAAAGPETSEQIPALGAGTTWAAVAALLLLATGVLLIGAHRRVTT